MKSKTKLNSRTIGALLLSSEIESKLLPDGQRVLEAAIASAPVKTGAYRDSLSLTVARTDRVVVRVGSTAPHAHLVEANTGNLNRALDAAG